MEILLYVLLLGLLALAVLAAYWVVRGSMDGQPPMVALFGVRPEKRLAVVEHASVDGRRKLVLVRRDDVEHLIMTGGPVDVVIETGIGERKPDALPARALPEEREGTPATPVFGRQVRAARAGQQIAE
ncbi:MAG: hypothetical protein AB7O57_18190 [Hyphomicrobiaceae bacterium]